MPTPAEVALTSEELARYNKVRGTLSGRLGRKVRKRLREEYAGYKKKIANPGRITGPLSPSKLAQEATNAGEYRYGTAIRDSEQTTRNIPSWYDNWKAQTQQAEASTAAAWQQAAQATQNMQTALGAQDASRAQVLDASAAADAARRGAAVSPEIQALAARAQASRNAQATDYTAFLGGQAASQRGYLQNRIANIDPQKLAALGREQTKRDDLTKQRGEFISEYLANARDKERQYGLERAAFGLDAEKAAADAAYKDTLSRTARTNARANKQRADWSTSPDNPDNQPKQTSGESGGDSKTGPTRAQSAAGKRAYVNARQQAKDWIRQGKLKKGQSQKWINRLKNEYGIEPVLARAAVMDALYGGVDESTRREVVGAYGFYPRLSRTERKKKRRG